MLRPYGRLIAQLDARFTSAAVPFKEALDPPLDGWIEGVRTALGFSLQDVASKLPINISALSKLQRSEREGTITLNKLRMVAEGLDCDLVYGFVPRDSFKAMADAQLAKVNSERRAKRSRPLLPHKD